MQRFKTILAYGVVIGAFFTLVALGIWQLERRVWKENLLAEIAEKTTGHEQPLAHSLPKDYMPVSVTGRFLPATILVHRGKEKMVFSPFQYQNGFIFVNRGTIAPERTSVVLPPSVTIIKGIVRFPPEQGLYTPDNNPDKDDWYFVDLGAMAKKSGIRLIQPFYVQLSEKAFARDAAEPLPIVPDLPNNHLQYALTWFALAGVLGVVIMIRKWKK